MSKPLVDINKILQPAPGAGCDAFKMLGASGMSIDGGQNIIDIIGMLQKDVQLVQFYTNGAFSLHQLLTACFEVSGPADMYCSTYAMSETAMRTISLLMDGNYIKSLHCVIDNRIETRTAGSLQLLRSRATRCVLAPCHAKATVLMGSRRDLVIIGSANYTENKRIETGFVMADTAAAIFQKAWIESTIAQHDH